MTLPIRVRMTALYVGLLAIVIAAVGAFLVLRLRADLTGAVDGSLQPAADQVTKDYRAEGLAEFRDSAGTVLKGERAAAQLLAADGRVLTDFGDPVARGPMLDRPQRDAVLRDERLNATRSLGPEDQPFRFYARRVVRDGKPQVVVVAQSLAPVQRSVRRVVILLLLAGPAALLATALGGWWLARRSLRPVEEITSTAEAIGVDRLGDRVAEPGTRDEIDHLARTINTMLDRIQHGVEEQRRLVADASHELRTPLAAMRAEVDVSLRADELSSAARTVLLSTREEIDRLSRTVDDLLTLASADDAAFNLVLAPTELGDLAAPVAEELAWPAAERRVTVEREGPPVTVLADAERLRQAVRNVLENAIDFSPSGGTVVLRTLETGGAGRLIVEDEGPGVPPDLRERVFDRFFRVDPSRSRASGGTGLGLAITREIVAAHGGRVWVEAREPRGSAFVLELRAVQAPRSGDVQEDRASLAP